MNDDVVADMRRLHEEKQAMARDIIRRQTEEAGVLKEEVVRQRHVIQSLIGNRQGLPALDRAFLEDELYSENVNAFADEFESLAKESFRRGITAEAMTFVFASTVCASWRHDGADKEGMLDKMGQIWDHLENHATELRYVKQGLRVLPGSKEDERT